MALALAALLISGERLRFPPIKLSLALFFLATVIACLLSVDPRLQKAVDRFHEVVAVELRVEADDARAQHPLEQAVPPGADPELGQGMCQNMITVARGSRSRIRRGASAKW